jgi:hypothetical protein
MFDDLDATLRALLDDAAAPSELRLADVSFETPGKDYAPAQETVNLFLREVRESAELRDPVPTIEQQAGGGFTRRQPPLRVECRYLLTTWADPSQAAAMSVLAEHRLLGQALAWLRRFPTIPAGYLQGSLASQEIPPPAVVARPGGGDTGEFWTWSALGIAPRPALDLTVTIAMTIDLAIDEGPPVVTSELRLAMAGTAAAIFEVAGTVSRALAAVPGAQVALQPGGATVVTDELGHFSFSGLAGGTYSLSTSTAGQPATSTTINVPATTAHAYDVNLPP